MGCNGKDNKPGITLNGPELSFDALDVAMLQVGSDALVEPGKRFQCGPGFEVWLLGIDANMFDKELVAANASAGSVNPTLQCWTLLSPLFSSSARLQAIRPERSIERRRFRQQLTEFAYDVRGRGPQACG